MERGKENVLMKKRTTRLTIPDPCGEDWDNMQPTKCGSYCGVCEFEVIDFTKMSDRQLVNYFEEKTKTKDKVCGKFRETQLNTDIIIRENSSAWLLKFKQIMLGLFLGMSLPSVLKAEKPKVVLVKSDEIDTKGTNCKTDSIPNKIEGIVLDENGEPMFGASIVLDFPNSKISTSTNFDGRFELEIPPKYRNDSTIITIRYIGYLDKQVKVCNNIFYEIYLNENHTQFLGLVVYSKPRFRYRFKNFFKPKWKKTRLSFQKRMERKEALKTNLTIGGIKVLD